MRERVNNKVDVTCGVAWERGHKFNLSIRVGWVACSDLTGAASCLRSGQPPLGTWKVLMQGID